MTSEISFTALKAYEPDRYYAGLLAPRDLRDDALAVVGFASELRRIARVVRQPMLAVIRLQWWHDTLRQWQPDRPSGSPLADGFAGVARQHGLPQEVIEAVIDGAAALCANDSPGTLASSAPGLSVPGQIVPKLIAMEGGLFTLSALILGGSAQDGIIQAAKPAGVAYGAARFLYQGLLNEAVAGDDGSATSEAFVCDMHSEARAQLTAARLAVAALPGPTQTAFLPLALVEPYLRLAELGRARIDTNPGRRCDEALRVSQLRRMWLIWRRHIAGRLSSKIN